MQIYKIPDGKPENQFAFNGDAKNADFATTIIAETHKFWQNLVHQTGTSSSISTWVSSCSLSLIGKIIIYYYMQYQHHQPQLGARYPQGGG